MDASTNDQVRRSGIKDATLTLLEGLADGAALGEFLTCKTRACVVRLTTGIQALGWDLVQRTLAAVGKFRMFSDDNDPDGDHDFGSLTIEGKKVYWKIDDVSGRLTLTVMLADEF